ncbi:cation:proton antiporter [Noviherbaspirillum autotrophicum]|uniref:Sodium:proton antiporter n=1 Tax=Noviherbaspirillum autotrophicum TaxID=709839 RepID=A0A0C2BIX9_9BURK|nr:cation:proton antiporter [Noviherbaspirillum autotrophicum]KIF79929.1 sodium:proton antiporter [Noviherbaspirillum autotrophicum]
MDFLTIAMDMAWPVAVAIAWIAGEFGHRVSRLPRISIYGVTGFLLGQTGLFGQATNGAVMLLANVAFGLILFEFGYRINLKWLRVNPWMAVTGVVEAVGSFAAVFALAYWTGMSTVASLLLASLAMSTSPAAILRIINESRSSGQVTERVLHLSALNCALAVFAFKVIVGLWTFQSSGSLLQAAWNGFIVLLASVALGTLFGGALPGLLRRVSSPCNDATVAFAIAVILLVALTHTLKLSPVLAALTFGITARHRRTAPSQTQRNFGALGDLLTVLLFVFIAATLDWRQVVAGFSLGLALVAVRQLVKVAAVLMFARVSGISWRKGALTGLALMPMSVFVILLLEQARYIGIELPDRLAPLASATLLLELAGPILTQRALQAAGEAREITEQ